MFCPRLGWITAPQAPLPIPTPPINSYIHACMRKCRLFLLALQMWTLGRFLPLAIGHLITEGDEYWENFLGLLHIMDILFARHVTEDACAYLEVLISDHHSTFRELYPGTAITMKMHSMIHMPQLMLQ